MSCETEHMIVDGGVVLCFIDEIKYIGVCILSLLFSLCSSYCEHSCFPLCVRLRRVWGAVFFPCESESCVCMGCSLVSL